jgi:hypothetical protein
MTERKSNQRFIKDMLDKYNQLDAGLKNFNLQAKRSKSPIMRTNKFKIYSEKLSKARSFTPTPTISTQLTTPSRKPDSNEETKQPFHMMISHASPFSIKSAKSDHNLGPGSYNPNPYRAISPSFNFPISTRFVDSYEDKLRSSLYSGIPFLHRELTEQEKQNMQLVYERNLDLSRHTPVRKRRLLELRAQSRASKENSVKSMKESLVRSMIEQRRSRLIEKERHYHMRNHPEFYKKVKLKWIALLVLLNLPRLIYWKTMAKKRLRVRSFRHISFLFLICRAIGKFKRKLLKARVKIIKSVRNM